MPKYKYRSRAESPVVLPFLPFTRLESLLGASELAVETRFGLYRVGNGARLKCAPEHLPKVALTLELNCQPSDLAVAIEEGKLDRAHVRFALLAREPKGGHLRQTDVLWTGKWSDIDGEELVLLERGAERPRTLQNAFDGFELHFVAVLDEMLKDRLLMPPRRGTIIAEAIFGVLPFGRVSGLQPMELTPQVRHDEKLRASAWLFVKRITTLHDSQRLSDAVEIYVDEEILRLTALQRSSMRTVAESLFAIPALTQVVFLLSEDLQGDQSFEWDGSGSEALSLIYDTVKACGPEMDRLELVRVLRTQPERIAAIVSGYDAQKRRIVDILRADSEEADDAVPGD